MIEDYLRKRETLLNIFVLVDSRHEPQKIDLEFVNELASWNVPFTLVFTKADKEKPGVVQRNVKAFFDEMLKTWQFLPQAFITSANTKQGRDDILKFIQEKLQAQQAVDK
jgi:GTP-binding protein